MTIYEPATLVTDALLAALGGFLSWRLWVVRQSLSRSGRWWLVAMGLLTISALVGGSYHGFAPNFPWVVDQIWWRLVLAIISLLGYSLGAALVAEFASAQWQRILRMGLLVKLLVVLGVIMVKPYFVIAIIDYGSSMLAWLIAAMVGRRPWRNWAIVAVFLSGVAAWIQQQSGLKLWVLNHNDLFHLIQAAALVGFYRVARLCLRVHD